LGLIAVGTGLWLFQQQASQNAQLQPDTSQIGQRWKKRSHRQKVSQLEAEAEKHESLATGTVAQLSAELDRQEIHLAVTGGKAVGKTT